MLQEILANTTLWVAILASLLAQALKLVVHYVRSGKIDFRVLVETGGMPSSHAAMVTALTICVGIQQGWDSLLFAVTFVFASIVMYDAAGIRQAAGKQAQVLNSMLDEFFDETTHHLNEVRLKELLGHTPLQVIAGAAVGGVFAGISIPLWVH